MEESEVGTAGILRNEEYVWTKGGRGAADGCYLLKLRLFFKMEHIFHSDCRYGQNDFQRG